MQRVDYEHLLCAGVAEINACLATLPDGRRQVLHDLVDVDVSQSLDLLGTELQAYRAALLTKGDSDG